MMAKTEEQYGHDYRAHLLEQYRLYVEMADKMSERRQSANSFFLSVNTVIVGLVSYFTLNDACRRLVALLSPINIAGLVICYTWYRLMRSYRDLNTAKFKVIHELEQELPASPYDCEWEKVGRGTNRSLYLPITRVEMSVPWVFFGLHACVLALFFVSTVSNCNWDPTSCLFWK